MLVVLALTVLLAAEGPCTSTPPPQLRQGEYAFTMIPTGAYLRGMPRLELSAEGAIDGHDGSYALHCRGPITDAEWVQLTDALNAADALERGDYVEGCGGVSTTNPQWDFCTDTIDRAHHCFRYLECPVVGRTIEQVMAIVRLASTITDRLSASGACGPDSYSYP